MRITVAKSDEPAAVVDKLIATEAKEVVLTVPRFSVLAKSAANFRLIKREAEALGKRLAIWSVDDAVADLCERAGIPHHNPFFGESERHISDIVKAPRRRGGAEENTVDAAPFSAPVTADLALARTEAPSHIRRAAPRRRMNVLPLRLGKRWIAVAALIAAVGGTVAMLSKAEVVAVRERKTWSFRDTVTASTAAAAADAEKNVIPAQQFSREGNAQTTRPASGKRFVERRASGKILVWNAHSSDPQPLVSRTRFVAPDGKVFRLTKGITVPGAKVVEGKIQPSSIEAEVVADGQGETYNIGPVERFAIPGFAGTPKENTFYGESREPIAGGFAGEAAVPTDADVKGAKEAGVKELKDSIRTLLLAGLASGMTVLEGAETFVLAEQTVGDRVDEKNNFTVHTAGTMSVMALRRADVVKMLLVKAQAELGADMTVAEESLVFGTPAVDVKGGAMRIPIEYTAQFVKPLDAEALKRGIRGKTEEELAATLRGFPGLERASVNLWPFWVRRVPENIKKITVEVK